MNLTQIDDRAHTDYTDYTDVFIFYFTDIGFNSTDFLFTQILCAKKSVKFEIC